VNLFDNTDKNEIISFFNQADFVLQTILQINKDLNGLSLQVIIPETIDKNSIYDDLRSKLQIIIKNLSQNNSSLAQFIYQVDLKESEFIDSLNDSTLSILAEKVLIREAQKVFLRMKFS